MKNKFLPVFVAAFTAAMVSGCQKPENGGGTEPGPNLDERVSLGLSSQELTKTVLGEPDGNFCPVYWSEGDRVAVNGKRSEPLHGIEDKTVEARFEVTGVAAPYAVVYPSWICGAMDGNTAEITLQTVQKWTPGSFGNGSAILYGYSQDREIVLRNLCGVVRIAVDFGDYEITGISLASLDEPLAGKFSLNLETGELTPSDAGHNIELSVPAEGFGGQKAELNFCVPSGEYAGGFNITITERLGRQMVIELRANTAVGSGVIVGWPEQTFKPSGALVITNPESWNSFAAAVNAGDYSSWKDPDTGEVTVGADFINGGDLAQINEWDGVLNGGDRTITRNSISKPLFKTIKEGAVVKDLTLSGLRTEPGANSSATLAATNLGTIENCENRAGLTVSVDDNFHFCGLVEANGGMMRGCVNSADFEIDLPFTANHEFMGGGIAFRPDVIVTDGTTKLGTFDGCRNTGNITVKKNATAASDLYKCAVGGILSCADGGTAESFVTLKNCVNEGNITLWENTFKNAGAQGAYAVGGIVGRIAPLTGNASCSYVNPDLDKQDVKGFYAEITGCSNVGTIDVCCSISSNAGKNMSGARQCHVGGISGIVIGKADKSAVLKDCTNSGKILAGGTNAACALVGGILGSTAFSEITSCTNNGSFGLTQNTLAKPNSKIGSVGGIVSFVMVKASPAPTISGCTSTAALPSDAEVVDGLKGTIYAAGKIPTIK